VPSTGVVATSPSWKKATGPLANEFAGATAVVDPLAFALAEAPAVADPLADADVLGLALAEAPNAD